MSTFDTYRDSEPDFIIKGFRDQWKLHLDYDAVDFDLSYQIYRVNSSTGTIIGPNGDAVVGVYSETEGAWLFEISSVISSQFSSGPCRYILSAIRKSDSERELVRRGTLNIFADTDDQRNYAEKILAKIESILMGRADSDVDSYSIKSRSLTKMSIKDLIYWRDYFRNELDRLGGSEVPKGPKRNKVKIRCV